MSEIVTGVGRMPRAALFLIPVLALAPLGCSPTEPGAGPAAEPPAAPLAVIPPEDFQVEGPPGGPFTPLAAAYELANTGSQPIDWTVSLDAPWIGSAQPLQGLLGPGETHVLVVQIDASYAASLPVGTHATALHFIDDTLAIQVASYPIVVDVKAPTPANGWTDFALAPGADSRTVYVSSSQGSDSGDGLSQASAKKTLAAGKALVRDGFPDRLLLKKGDSWNEGFGQWTKSGQSKSAVLLVSTYGSGARPRVRPIAGQDGFAAYNGNPHDIALVDLHFVPQGPGGAGNAVAWLTGGERLLVEGCLMENFQMAVVLQGGGEMSVRRNVMTDMSTSGMYVSDVAGLLIEENLIDRMGLASPTVFKHGIYLDNEGNTGMVVRGNIISNTSSHGLHLRPGGTAEDNLFVRTSIALQLGGGDSWQANPGGVHGVIRRNVILDGKNIDASNPRGWGLLFQNVASAWVEDNVIANAPEAGNPRPIELDGWTNGKLVHNATFQRNVVSGWGGTALRAKGAAGVEIKHLTLIGNDLQNEVDAGWLIEVDDDDVDLSSFHNRCFSAGLPGTTWFSLGGVGLPLASFMLAVGDFGSTAFHVSYPEPDASLAAYNALLGGTASHDAFMAEARKQSKDNWRPEYTAPAVNALVRAAFGKFGA